MTKVMVLRSVSAKSMILVGAAAAVALGACNKAGETRAAKVDVASIEQSIKDDENKWNQDFQLKSLDGILSHYAADATMVAPGSKAITGADGIRAAYTEALKDPAWTIDFSSDRIDVAASGDLAYSRGHYTATGTDPKTKKVGVLGTGSYVTVYKKQSDGNWKATEDVVTMDPPAAAPAAG